METLSDPSRPSPFIDDVIENMLAGWSGLRHYLKQRRAGCPADPVMESLLTEWVRANLPRKGDVRRTVEFLCRGR